MTAQMAMKMKKMICAMADAPAATSVKPNMPAMIAMSRKKNDQLSMMMGC
jgi:hypothetical protein